MSRSNSSSHHQRQYSDHIIDASSKWLQSSTSLSQVNAFSIFVLLIIIAESDYEVVLLYIYIYVQDFGFYGGGVQGSRMSRNIVDPPTPLGSRSMSLRRNGDDQVSPTSEFSPGLLDLHSFDTELLPEVCSHFFHILFTILSCKSFFFFCKMHVIKRVACVIVLLCSLCFHEWVSI